MPPVNSPLVYVYLTSYSVTIVHASHDVVCSPCTPASALAKKTFRPTVHVPGLQYVAKVDAGSSADKAGLREGDFLLEVSWVTCVHTYVGRWGYSGLWCMYIYSTLL